MKICEYIPTASFYVGGGEVYPLMQARALANEGEEVTLAVLKTESETEYFKKYREENPNIRYLYLESLSESIIPFAKREMSHDTVHELYFSLSRELSQLCSEEKFDVVIVHYGPAAVSVPKKTKEILFLHGVPSTFQVINKTALLVADKLLAVSKSVGQGWSDLFGVDKSIDVLYNAADSEKFFPDEAIEKDIDILYLGRIIEIKGVQFLLQAVSILNKEKGMNIKLTVAGDGPYRKELEKQAEELGIGERVEFLGFLDEEKKREIYNRAKVCVFPSYAKEGVLTTMLEAAACGCAIITTNACGMVDFMDDGVEGLLCKPQDGADLAQKILTLYTDGTLREKLGSQAREKVEKDWSWRGHANKLVEIINQLTKE